MTLIVKVYNIATLFQEQSDSDEEEPEVPAKRKKDSRELVTVVMVKNWTKRMQVGIM